MANYSEGFDDNALAMTKSVLTKSNARAFETTGSLMGVLQNISRYGLANNYVEEQQAVLHSMSLSKRNRLFQPTLIQTKWFI
jgi:zinc protease